MYPYFFPEIFGYNIVMYDVIVIIGVFFMLLYIAKRLERVDGYTVKQTNKLLILIVVSLFIALFSSWFFDGIFHSIENGELSFGTITFLYGLIGGVVSFLILLKYFYKEDNKNVRNIMNTIITGVVLAHAIGRIGCFFAGCCFGTPTDSPIGVIFPHGHAHTLYGDQAVIPTQLLESSFLFVLFFIMNKVKLIKSFEIETYLLAYGIWRFTIEFFRGDDRGVFIPLFETEYNVFPTPSQIGSFIMIILATILIYRRKKGVSS